jgi:exonuclease SbcC
MKILNIHFKNINSLEGESRIDFEQAPFSDTGVFAITGPNGSGKSSILDAITLGLYGETFRFDRPARHVMTKHTAECFSEIEFSLDNEKYRSSWHVQRVGGDPEGELTFPEMKLIRLNDEEVLATTPQQVCSRITEITGMNFRNFTRSILLAQGDFSAFLNALDSERMDILEKIISTDIYADYKKEITEKADNAQKRLDQLKRDLASIPVMGPEKLEACEHDLSDFNDQYAELQDEQNSLKQQQASLENIVAIQNQIADQEKNLREAKEQAESKQKTLARLVSAQDALIFKDDVRVINEKSQDIQQGKTALAAFRSELKQIEDQIGIDKTTPEGLSNKTITEQKEAIAGVRAMAGQLISQRQSEANLLQALEIQIKDKKSGLAKVSAWLEEHAADESLLENFPETGKLKKLRAELVELKEKQKSSAKWSKNTLSSLKKNKFTIAQENKKKAGLKHKLSVEEKELEALAQGNNLDGIEELRLEQKERVNAFQELNSLALANQKLVAPSSFSFFGKFRKKDEPEHDADELSLEIEKLKQEISREENIKRALDAAVFREALLKKMTADRRHLADGQPCPLCGALAHPYAKHAPIEANSQQALADQQAKIKALMAGANKLVQQHKQLVQKAEKNQANRAQLQKINAQWLMLCNKLNTASNQLDINNIRLMKRLLKGETIELKNIGILAVKYRNKQNGIEKLKALIDKSDAAIEQLLQDTQKLDSEWQGRPQEQIDYESALAKCQQEEKELADKVIKQLTLLGEKMPVKGKEDALYDRLNVRRRDYHNYAFRRKVLTEDMDALAAKEVACRAEITACNDKLERYNSQLQSEEFVGLHLALIEKQKLIADKEQLIAQQETEIGVLQQALQEKMRGTRFTSPDELGEILEAMQNQSELERQIEELVQEIDARTIKLEKNQAQLASESANIKAEPSQEEIDVQLKGIAVKMEIANMEAQRLEKLVNEQKQLQQKYDAGLTQVQNQEELAQQFIAEVAQMTEESGMDFRRRVQGRLADKLLSQTNEILEKISGRYYLRQMPSEQGLALEIEDTYQGNVRRLPKTLSGGESFVVSLALALGLSELANNGKSVDSLFLDEGFGNLDAETLYTVISTLEGLHTHGKTVGVISHVEGVQKRFKAQLQVVKKPNGMGELKKAS